LTLDSKERRPTLFLGALRFVAQTGRKRNTLMQKMPVIPRDDLDQEALKEGFDIPVLRVRCSWLRNWFCDGQHA
jgi:hypothetical protein